MMNFLKNKKIYTTLSLLSLAIFQGFIVALSQVESGGEELNFGQSTEPLTTHHTTSEIIFILFPIISALLLLFFVGRALYRSSRAGGSIFAEPGLMIKTKLHVKGKNDLETYLRKIEKAKLCFLSASPLQTGDETTIEFNNILKHQIHGEFHGQVVRSVPCTDCKNSYNIIVNLDRDDLEKFNSFKNKLVANSTITPLKI